MSDMTEIGIEDLKRIMRASAGEDEAVDLDGEILDITFADMGYDSLALLETTGQISREYGVALTDAELDGVETPRALLDAVNAALVRV